MTGQFPPPHTKFWQIHFYRSKRDDAGYKPIPIFEDLVEADIKTALVDRFKPKKGFLPPLYADVVDETGKVVMSLRRTFNDQAEIITSKSANPTEGALDAD